MARAVLHAAGRGQVVRAGSRPGPSDVSKQIGASRDEERDPYIVAPEFAESAHFSGVTECEGLEVAADQEACRPKDAEDRRPAKRIREFQTIGAPYEDGALAVEGAPA